MSALNIQGFAIRRPVATLTILLIMVVVGTVSLSQTPLNLLPDIEPPVLAIVTVFPGCSPQEAMTLVAAPIEEAMASVSGLTNIQSISQENMAVVILQFYWGANIKAARDEVDTRLNFLSLPDGINRPLLAEFDPTMLPVLEIAVTGSESSAALTRQLQDQVIPRLESLTGVASVQLTGGVEEDIFVRLSPEKMQEYQVSLDQVGGILGVSLLDFPAGILELDERQMRLRFIGQSRAADALDNVIVGFQVDQELLRAQLNRTVDVDLNKLLLEDLPNSVIESVPMNEVMVRDVMLDWEEDTRGDVLLALDPLKLKHRGLSHAQVVSGLIATGVKPEITEDGAIRLCRANLPPGDLGSILVSRVPDFTAWYSKLRDNVATELDYASERIEQALAGAAMAMLEYAKGGGIPILGADFPLQPILLGDIARLELSAHPPDSISRVDQLPSMALSVQKEGAANTVQVARLVRRELANLGSDYPGLSFYPVFDQAGEIENALGDLSLSLVGGAMLAVIVLLLFLRDWKTTLLIGAAIPVSVLFTFTLLYFANLSINIMTMGGLALAAGLLVDNAIVVSENIYRHLQMGAAPREAALKGSREVAGAIVASTLTTISVFFPVVFIGGLAGELFTEFALAVTCALLSSLLVSLTLIPLMASRFFRAGNGAKSSVPGLYQRILTWSLARPWAPLSLALAVLVAAGLTYTVLGTDLFPPTQENSFAINIHMPAGTPMAKTDECVAEIEEVLAKYPEIRRFSSRTGSSQIFGISVQGGVSSQAKIRVKVHSRHAGKIAELMEAVRGEIAALDNDAQVFMKRENLLNSAGLENRLELAVEGDDREVIAEIAARAVEELKKLPFLEDIQYTQEDNRPELHLAVNQGSLLQKGLSAYQLASTLRLAIEGLPVARIPVGDELVQIILILDRSELSTAGDLEELGFYAGGNLLRLGDVASIQEGLGPASITRQNRRLTGEILAEYRGMDMAGARNRALAALEKLDLPQGYRIRAAGAISMLDDVLSDLWLVLAVAGILVYLVMSAQFESFLNPFIIICSLPLAYAGSIFLLFLTGSSLNVPVLIGGIVLAGILVNDGIILVDLISQKHREGVPLAEAAIQGATARLRPVLMTTITTILGVFPLVLGLGAGSQLQAPMGLTIIGGQVVGTLLLLVVVPVLYYLFNSRRGMG